MPFMRAIITFIVSLAVLASLGGCFPRPVIDRTAFEPPKSVALVETPPMQVGVIFEEQIWLDPPDHMPQPYFSAANARFFGAVTAPATSEIDHREQAVTAAVNNLPSMPGGYSASNAATAGVVGGVMGALIEVRARNLRTAAAAVPDAARRSFPDHDDRAAFFGALRKALKERGLDVTPVPAAGAPRLRWPATDEAARADSPPAQADAPPVDADLLLQVSPVIAYRASGALNPFYLQVGVGVAMFDGRTKRFIGRQNFFHEFADPVYYSIDQVIEGLPASLPQARRVLQGFVPAVADLAAGSPVR
jgi:hypothetical protein